ncbi:hypothetical protein LZF95_02835 [Algoriphagus sp. AGSA1]|nr:hypothetical protein [Algoriphagus sp. AGSA1]
MQLYCRDADAQSNCFQRETKSIWLGFNLETQSIELKEEVGAVLANTCREI